MLMQLMKKCKYGKNLYEILVVMKIYLNQNHGVDMIRQIRYCEKYMAC